LYDCIIDVSTEVIDIEKKIKAAVLGLVIIAAIFAGLSSAQYAPMPTQQTPTNNPSIMNTNKSMTTNRSMTTNQSTIEKTETTEKNESTEHETQRIEMLENQNEMMNETRRMMNQTNEFMKNQSRVFQFRNHTVVVTVINESKENDSPRIKIDEPKESAVISTNNVTIKSNYTFFSVIPHFGMANVRGQGHLHYFKDVTAPTTPGQPAITATGTWNQSANFLNNWTNLAPGRHKFSVELVQNDHTPLVPPVVATVNVTIQGTNMTNVTTTQLNITKNITISKTTNQSVTIALSAQNLKFNQSTISVPAGAMVTVKFDNKDNGIPHTFSVYQSSAATQTIFKGQTINGPSNTTYTFMAPSKPGTYFFRCDIHPTVMTGNFIVT
jgi:plastocyanin